MFLYLIYIFFLLSVIAFSPTRYFSFSLLALISFIPGLVYCLLKKPSKVLWCLFLLFLVTLYSGWNSDLKLVDYGKNISSLELISSAAIWLIAFVSMKLSIYNNMLRSLNFIRIFVLAFFVLGLISMIFDLFGGSSAMNEGSNSVYFVLPILPCLIYYFPRYKYFAIVLIAMLIIVSIKRSAIIIVAISLLWILFCYFRGIIKLNKSVVRALIVSIMACFVISFWAVDYIEAVINRFSSISDDGGSGRDVIYEYAWNMFLQTDLGTQFFGNGPRYFWANNSNVTATHNDFLEILISCGLIGVILFLYLHMQLLRMLFYLVGKKSELSIPMGICYFTFLVWNLIACQFAYQSTTVGTFMFIALIEDLIIRNEKNSVYCN